MQVRWWSVHSPPGAERWSLTLVWDAVAPVPPLDAELPGKQLWGKSTNGGGGGGEGGGGGGGEGGGEGFWHSGDVYRWLQPQVVVTLAPRLQ